MSWITDPDGVVRFYCACAHPAPPRRDVPLCRWCGVTCCEACVVYDDEFQGNVRCYCSRCWEIGVYYRQRLTAAQTRYNALQAMCIGLWKAAALEAAAGVARFARGEDLARLNARRTRDVMITERDIAEMHGPALTRARLGIGVGATQGSCPVG